MSDILIIGGGIIGLLTARELADGGASVTLLERANAGRESSWAGGGIVSPLYPWRYASSITALASWSQRHYPDLAAALAQDSGVDPEYLDSGLLILDQAEHHAALDWGRRTANRIELIDTPQIAVCEPSLAGAPEHALWMPQVAQIRNPRLARAAREAVGGKIDVREQTEVSHILIQHGRVRGVQCGGTRLLADRVIVCAGAWSARLLKSLPTVPQIEPVRGQMILFRARPGLIRRIVLSSGRYVIPRRDGRVLMGSTLEYGDFAKTTTQSARDELHARAADLFPALREFPVEHHWAGLRPGSPGGIPYIGPYPGIDGLYINSGHFRNGVVLAPASCRLLADLVLGRPPILAPGPYALEAPRPPGT